MASALDTRALKVTLGDDTRRIRCTAPASLAAFRQQLHALFSGAASSSGLENGLIITNKDTGAEISTEYVMFLGFIAAMCNRHAALRIPVAH
jgi:hypothetical protein